MKKFVSVLLCILMIMPFAMPFVSAAEAVDKIVLEINTDIGGELVDSYKNYITIKTEGIKFEESMGPAVEAYNNSSMSYDSEFVEGAFYTFTIKLTEEPYFALPMEGSFVPVEINGEKYAVMTQIRNTGYDIITYISFEVELYVGDPMKCLKAVDFKVPAPVVGAMPADVSQVWCNNMGVNVVSISWFPEDPVFVEGTQYGFQLALETAEGYVFDKNIYLSHDMADAIKVGNGKNELKMTYTFPVLEAEKIVAADFTIPLPVAGNYPATSSDVACSDSNICIAAISWDPADVVFNMNVVYTATISIEAKSGYKFDTAPAFTVNGESANKIGNGTEELKVSYTFPATAQPVYCVNVTGGTASATSATAGTTITIKADEAPVGKEFDKWVATGITLGDPTKSENYFYMPSNDVSVQAVYKDIFYSVAVTNGTASASKAIMGETVNLKADDASEGKEFDKWVIVGATVADVSKAETSFVMSAENVTVEATYKNIIYSVSVTDGTASVSGAAMGETVTLTANAAPTGKQFDKWVADGVTLDDATKSTATFVMPAKEVTAQATFKPVIYSLNIINGTASETSVTYNTTVDISANQIDGKVFSHWDVVGATASDKDAKETTVTVGTSDVTAEAVYEDCPCKCHKGGIAGFFYKIVLFFQKLFGQNKICAQCGAKH